MEGYYQEKMMVYYKRMLMTAVPLGCRPAPALRLKLTASAFFEVAVTAATEGNLDAAQKAMTSGRAALDSMGRMGDTDAHTRNSWGMAARQRVDAAFARWEAAAPARAAAAAAAEEERTRWAAVLDKRREQEERALAIRMEETAEAAAKVALHEELAAIFTADPFDCDMPQPESAAPSSKNPFDDF